MTTPDPQALIAELRRASALFQARTIAAVLDAPMPDPQAFLRASPKTQENGDG